ncbi:MAG: hypothetical protein A2014_10335 [Spirochaetes bacterium GWF1_49_6]|nr:MAG: hypothetical protein A2014_10335 [Spirochaetes bacterium GWF1_49_6]
MTDTELKIKGFEILSSQLGLVEMEKFISLIQLEKFDYTKWRQNLFGGMSGKDISAMAMKSKTGK